MYCLANAYLRDSSTAKDMYLLALVDELQKHRIIVYHAWSLKLGSELRADLLTKNNMDLLII